MTNISNSKNCNYHPVLILLLSVFQFQFGLFFFHLRIDFTSVFSLHSTDALKKIFWF